jgi:uncharacterized protein YbjT (DUF2867 family)
MLQTAQALGRLPVAPVPAGFRFQPIAAVEVAERLAELALGEPAGLVADVGGPEVIGAKDLVRDYLRSAGRRRPVVGFRAPGRAAAAFRDGANLAPEHAVGRRTWTEFLAATVTR